MACERRSQLGEVSDVNETLILVDGDDNEIGYRSKAECHTGHGLLHRAFSIFIFDSSGRALLQQRSRSKPLWPLFWSNSCCSHPRRGESLTQATQRRLWEELGIHTDLRFLYKFIYRAGFEQQGAEHELCSVFVGFSDELVRAHPKEVENWRLENMDRVSEELDTESGRFTPWFRLEWDVLMRDFRHLIHNRQPALKQA